MFFSYREQEQQQQHTLDRRDSGPSNRAPLRLLGVFPVDEAAEEKRYLRQVPASEIKMLCSDRN